MWDLLQDIDRTSLYTRSQHWGDFSPMVRVLQRLSYRDYARSLYAFTSLYTFVITPVALYSQHWDHDTIRIHYAPRREVFEVGYMYRGTHRPETSYTCEEMGVLPLVNAFVLRLWLTDDWPNKGERLA